MLELNPIDAVARHPSRRQSRCHVMRLDHALRIRLDPCMWNAGLASASHALLECGVPLRYKQRTSFFLCLVCSIVETIPYRPDTYIEAFRMSETRNILTTGAPYHIIASVYPATLAGRLTNKNVDMARFSAVSSGRYVY